MAIRWLRMAGFDLYTQKPAAASLAFPWQAAASRATSMA
jgi:hypothetical protein